MRTFWLPDRSVMAKENMMKMKFAVLAGGLVATALYLGTGCDWSSQGTSLNTSQGAGININYSGVYNGTFGGGLAVRRTSKGNIVRLVINQAGNRIQVVDNQGSRYEGTVGAPGSISSAGADGTYSAGAQLVESQISFSGRDGVAQKDIEFVGIFHAVAVQDVRGTTTSESSGSGTTNATSTTDTDIEEGETTTTINDGVNTTRIDELIVGVQGSPGVFIKETITTVTKNETGEVVTRTAESETVTVNGESNVEGSSVVRTTTYTITEANTQYRLEGTWIEKDSTIVSDVDALSPGASGSITTTTTTDAGAGTDAAAGG